MTYTYKVTGMTCDGCVSTVQKVLSEINGVENVSVTLNPPHAVIKMQYHIDVSEMNSALQKSGNYSIEETASVHSEMLQTGNAEEVSKLKKYKPLIIVFLYILLGVALLQVKSGGFNLMNVMNNFMGGFFLVFSFFKLLDLKNFALSYSSYDIIAKKWFGYGYLYPFIELTLGILFILKANPVFTNAAAVIVMGISSIGVIQTIMKKRKIQCACLGTVFNLPMSTITVIEDLMMVAMAVIMLIYML